MPRTLAAFCLLALTLSAGLGASSTDTALTRTARTGGTKDSWLKAGPPPTPVAATDVDHAATRFGKTVTIQFEFLTSQLAGPDIGFFTVGGHNIGLGGSGFSGSGASYVLLHPRYRYYASKRPVTPVLELGGLYFSAQGNGNQFKAWGGDTAWGFAYLGRRDLTTSLMMSFPLMNVSGSGPGNNFSVPAGAVVIGWTGGFAF